MSEGGSGTPAARARRWLSIATLLMVTGATIAVGLEVSLALGMEWAVADHVERVGAGAMALAGGFIGVLALGLYGLTGRLRWGIPLAAMAGTVVMAVNYLKVRSRSEPLYPSDFTYVGEAELLVSSVGARPTVALVAVVLGVGVFAWAFVVGLGRALRVPPAPGIDGPRWVWGLRATMVLAAGALVVSSTGFNAEHNPIKRAFTAVGSEWVAWSQTENYRVNGFLGGFLFNMPSAPMLEPDGYDRAAVVEAVDRYTAKAREINEGRDRSALQRTNVIIVLGESFIDPLRLTGLELAEDPIPFTRAVMGDTMSGTMRSVGLGGGTANVEFEVLTGMSTARFTQGVAPYQGLVAHRDRFPSVLSRFDATHSTVGIHPFAANFYRRADAYRAFGFDHIQFQDDMRATWTVADGGYIADGAAYEELLGHLRAQDLPVFAQVITMQNHAGYAGLYPDPIEVLAPESARDAWGLGDYLRGLRHADEALEGLLAEIEALGEPTVVLFYGDHVPPSTVPADLWAAHPSPFIRYETPWFVWSTDGVHPARHQGDLAPHHLWNQVLRATGAPVTPWDALLLELEAVNPRPVELHVTDEAHAEPELSQVERDHLLLQYDLAVGAGHATEALLTVPEN